MIELIKEKIFEKELITILSFFNLIYAMYIFVAFYIITSDISFRLSFLFLFNL